MATAKDNKILMGLENVHWFELTETTDTDGVVTTSYGTSHSWPGAVNLALSPEGDGEAFYADNGIYYMPGENVGYSGDLESALIPEDLKKYALGRESDSAGVVIETSQGAKKAFAITADLTGDQKARRIVLYKCFLARPQIQGSTKTNSNTPQTEVATLTVVPRADFTTVKRGTETLQEHLVQAATNAATNAEAYSAWHTAPYTPAYT